MMPQQHLDIAREVFSRYVPEWTASGKCSRKQVAAFAVVPTDPEPHPLAGLAAFLHEPTILYGVNGPALDLASLCTGVKGSCGCVHAEVRLVRSLLGHVGRNGQVRGASIFTSYAPCLPCAQLISSTGSFRAWGYVHEADHHREAMSWLDRCSDIAMVHLNDESETCWLCGEPVAECGCPT